MTSPSPGWYPDPYVAQQMRWWDGASWSEDTYERVEPLESWATPAVAARARGGAQVATTDDGVPVAGWWPRAAARIIDALLTGALAWAVGFGQAKVFVTAVSDQFSAAMRAAEAGAQAPAFVYDSASLKALTIISLLWLLVGLVYDMVFLLWRAATPGKLVLGLRVRRWTPGERLTAGVIARRWLAFQVASTVSYLGALYVLIDLVWPLRDARRQALHDKFAGTSVVTASWTRPHSDKRGPGL